MVRVEGDPPSPTRKRRFGVSFPDMEQALGVAAPVAPGVAQQIEIMDNVLNRQLTTEPTVVAVVGVGRYIPNNLKRSIWYHERKYLVGFKADTNYVFEDEKAVVWLSIPAGTPVFRPGRVEAGYPPVLIFGRGLVWKIVHAFQEGEQIVILATVLDRRPTRIHVQE